MGYIGEETHTIEFEPIRETDIPVPEIVPENVPENVPAAEPARKAEPVPA